MPWQPLPRIAFAVATYPFPASEPADLPLEIGDELYVIEETPNGEWLRGYLVAPPSLLAGLTSVKGQTLEARVFSGIFPRSCVEVREMLGDADDIDDEDIEGEEGDGTSTNGRNSANTHGKDGEVRVASRNGSGDGRKSAKSIKSPRLLRTFPDGLKGNLSIPVQRDPTQPRPPAPVPMLKVGDETPTSASEPLVDEIASCLREWHSTNLHELLLSREYKRLDQLAQLISGLNLHRQQLLYNVLTLHEFEQVREKAVWDLVAINKLCGGEVIVRDPKAQGRVSTGDDSAVEVTRLQSVMSLLNEPPEVAMDSATLYHLLLDVKGFAGSSTEDTQLMCYLVCKTPHKKLQRVSECFSVDIASGGAIGNITQHGQTKTLFTDLTPQDINDGGSGESELYLVVKVIASQRVQVVKPLSRTGTVHQTGYIKDANKPLSSSGPKHSSRRSFMWGNKPARSAFSRGASSSAKMEAVSEQSEDRPSTDGTDPKESFGPPSTAGSLRGASVNDTENVQRLIGIGVMKLNSIVKQQEETEQLMGIWGPSSRLGNEKLPLDEWDPIIKEIMDNPAGHYEKSNRGERLQVYLKGMTHSDANALIKSTPTILSGVSKTNRLGFSGAPSKPRSDIYITLDYGTLAKHNLLSRYGGSATSLPSATSGTNFQLTIEIRKSSGQRIENCIYTSSNTEPLTTFKSIAIERNEIWGQTLRLSLAPEDVPVSHVAMYLSDLPSPPFAVAYMPLWEREAFIRDGPHDLLLYKIDEYTASALAGPVGKGGYLSLPWSSKSKDERSAEVTGPLASILVETYLCSTKFSQDRVILGLTKWKEIPRDDIPAILNQLIFVPEIEVVKLLNNVLDGLFGILVEHSGNDEYEDLVFTALVRVLGIIHDRRFNLEPLVDSYAEQQFNYPFATSCLIRSFTRLLEHPTEPETARKLRSTFKVVNHILKFITRSRGQQKEKEAGIGIKSSTQGFSRDLRSIFKALDAMMRNSAPALVGSQTLAVQHFHTWLPELSGLLTTEEILHIAIDFMDSCTNVKGKLILYKLVLIINYSKLDLFAHPEQKSALSTNTARWIAPHWGHTEEINDQWREQIRLCCSVLASQMDHLTIEIPEHVPKIIDSYLALSSLPRKTRSRLSLLFPTSYPFPTKPVATEFFHDEALAELSAVLAAISNAPAGMQLEMTDDDISTVLENLLQVNLSILNGEAFPEDWLSVRVYHHKSTMRVLQNVAAIMLESFVPDPEEAEDFNTDLWKLFFTTLLKLVGSTSLALETFPEQKRRAVWKIAGDVREHGAELLASSWEAIGWEASSEEHAKYNLLRMGGYQVQYVPTLVGPIAELCLSVHEGLRRVAVEVLYTMIVSEWTLGEDLSAIQTEMIDCLDYFFKSKSLTESTIQKLFVNELLGRFEHLADQPDDPFHAAVRDLVATVDEFLDLLTAVHSGDARNEASHLISQLRLMEFLRDMQKEEIFVRYVHQLAIFQAESRNYAEAGLALRLHADLYEWDPVAQLPALTEPPMPAQTAFERKERIYFDMIRHFEEGKSWSNAITAYKELQAQYESNTFDFAKLGRTQRAIATVYDSISKGERITAKYFRVVFKGSGFPPSVRDKEFVYEGTPNERGSAFADRMQEQYPNAQIVTSGDVDEVEGQYLLISNVSANRDLTHPVFQRTRVSQAIREFLLVSHPQSFSISTKRSISGPVQEHSSEKVVFTTAEPFPTILRRSEVIEVAKVQLDAHDTALERIVRKTQEMAVLERRVADEDTDAVKPLADAIDVSVDPVSTTSIVWYRQLLPTPRDELELEDDDSDADNESEEGEEQEEALTPREIAIKMSLIDHAIMIKKSLAVLSRYSGGILALRHGELKSNFESTYHTEIAIFSPIQPQLEIATPSSPSCRKSSPSPDPSTPTATIAAVINGVHTEEMSFGKPVNSQQRSNRLSFLHKKKPSEAHTEVSTAISPVTNGGDLDSPTSPHSRTVSRDAMRRNSFFRVQSAGHGSNHSGGGGAGLGIQDSRRAAAGKGENGTPAGGPNPEVPTLKKGPGSVRKRLSMLRLGGSKKSAGQSNGKGNVMGSLNEG